MYVRVCVCNANIMYLVQYFQYYVNSDIICCFPYHLFFIKKRKNINNICMKIISKSEFFFKTNKIFIIVSVSFYEAVETSSNFYFFFCLISNKRKWLLRNNKIYISINHLLKISMYN